MKFLQGDCLERMKELEAGSVDAVVTDPPYGLSAHTLESTTERLRAWLDCKEFKPKGSGFMGKGWDAWVPGPEVWRECLRVLKPGGHMLVFAGTRSMDLMGMAVRLAGFELRDGVVWAYGSGFPKALDVSKAIDDMAGAEREVVGKMERPATAKAGTFNCSFDESKAVITAPSAPSTPAAKQWDGWKSALKPAWEPVLLCRKPLDGTIAENVLKHGVGALNVDGCRVKGDMGPDRAKGKPRTLSDIYGKANETINPQNPNGRYPANLIHSGSADVLACFPETTSGNPCGMRNVPGFATAKEHGTPLTGFGDSGSAARFFQCCPPDEDEPHRIFYSGKANKGDRDDGCEGFEERRYSHDGRKKPTESACQRNNSLARNSHPTVKPTSLMRYLCKLVTPPGGVVLDPFMGSGSTGRGARLEGFDFIGIEMDEKYFEIAKARVERTDGQQRGVVRDVIPGVGVQRGLFGEE